MYYSLSNVGKNEKASFLASLNKELLLARSFIDFTELNIESVSIGGGTPFELSVSHLSRLLETVEKHLNTDGSVTLEYSMEINPHDVSKPNLFREKVELLQSYNVNRLSFGAQSLDDQVLEANGARHTALEVAECVHISRECGFDNINLDLLFGLIGQTQQNWLSTLQQTCKIHPEHISVFALKSTAANSAVMSEEASEGRGYEFRIPLARKCCSSHGYIEYFPLLFTSHPEFKYKHDFSTFVLRNSVLGFGPGAITWINQFCYRNVRDLAKYSKLLNKGNLPVDIGTIHYPCENFLVDLAYIKA